MAEIQLYPSPQRQNYLRQQQLDSVNSLTYSRKVYSTVSLPSAFSSIEAGLFNGLLLEDGNSLALESGDTLVTEASSSILTSLPYLFRLNEITPSLLLAGTALGKSSGSDLEDLSVAFKGNFFKPGDVVTYQVNGKLSENATNTSLQFTITFPDDGTAATADMPTTVTQDALSDWRLTVISTFGYDANLNGTVSHSGSLVVTNSGASEGQTTTLLTVVSNTLDYSDILYYKPQVSWNTQSANSTTDFRSNFLAVT